MARNRTRDQRIDNKPFREAYLHSGMTPSEFAHAMGHRRRKKYHRDKSRSYLCAETTYGQRMLGLKPQVNGAGRKTFNHTVSIPDAEKMLTLFPSLDPVDVGL